MSGLSGGRAMLELAERCEKATGPDRELDADIYAAFGYCTIRARDHATAPCWQYYGSGALGEQRARASMRAFTASIDAALTLVPEGWLPLLDATDATEGRNYAELFDASDAPIPKACASSLALALCAAALRARAADTPSVKL